MRSSAGTEDVLDGLVFIAIRAESGSMCCALLHLCVVSFCLVFLPQLRGFLPTRFHWLCSCTGLLGFLNCSEQSCTTYCCACCLEWSSLLPLWRGDLHANCTLAPSILWVWVWCDLVWFASLFVCHTNCQFVSQSVKQAEGWRACFQLIEP